MILKNTIQKLVLILPTSIIPEVGINFAYALKNAQKLKEICAVSGRIIKSKDRAVICGTIDFESSQHVASVILAGRSADKNIRSAVNIRYSKELMELCKYADLSIGSFDRKNEPTGVTSTMEWGTKYVISKLGYVPDVIYDRGSIGKEPMMRVLGNNPEDVLNKLKKFINISYFLILFFIYFYQFY